MRYDNEQTHAECIALIGSVTQAMQAQGVLANQTVRTQVVKADSSLTGHGCAYALIFPCGNEETVKSVLKKAGFRVRIVRR